MFIPGQPAKHRVAALLDEGVPARGSQATPASTARLRRLPLSHAAVHGRIPRRAAASAVPGQLSVERWKNEQNRPRPARRRRQDIRSRVYGVDAGRQRPMPARWPAREPVLPRPSRPRHDVEDALVPCLEQRTGRLGNQTRLGGGRAGSITTTRRFSPASAISSAIGRKKRSYGRAARKPRRSQASRWRHPLAMMRRCLPACLRPRRHGWGSARRLPDREAVPAPSNT